eukprot:9065615-Alexandrium_andersonii.AAC.1
MTAAAPVSTARFAAVPARGTSGLSAQSEPQRSRLRVRHHCGARPPVSRQNHSAHSGCIMPTESAREASGINPRCGASN